MSSFEKIYIEIKDIVQSMARKEFHSERRKLYHLALRLDWEDLCQEGYVKAAEVFEKYKTKSDEEIKKLIFTSIKNRWSEMLRRGVAYTEDVSVFSFANNKFMEMNRDKDIEYQCRIEKEIGIKLSRDHIEEEIRDKYNILNTKKYLTTYEYQILYRRFEEGKTFEVIAKELGRAKSSIHERYIKILAKVKKIL